MIKEWEHKQYITFVIEEVQAYVNSRDTLSYVGNEDAKIQVCHIEENIIDDNVLGVEVWGINKDFIFKHQWIGKYFYIKE